MKVLLADADQQRADEVERRLAEAGATEVVRLSPGRRLAEAVKDLCPDVVIVDMSRPDRDGLDGIREVSSRDPKPIVMFVDHDDPAFMEEAIGAGVSSYNVLGSAVPDVKPIVQAAVAMFRRYRKVETDLRKAEETLNERNIVHRAKLLLMQNRRISEPEAHGWLRRRAMNQGKRIVEVATEMLREAEKKR